MRCKVQRGQVTKVSGLCREEPLGEEQPSPWAEEFRVASKVFQTYSVTDRDCEMLGESSHQVHYYILIQNTSADSLGFDI